MNAVSDAPKRQSGWGAKVDAIIEAMRGTETDVAEWSDDVLSELAIAALGAIEALTAQKPLEGEQYRMVHDAAIAAYEAATPSDYRYSAIALRKAVDAAVALTQAPVVAVSDDMVERFGSELLGELWARGGREKIRAALEVALTTQPISDVAGDDADLTKVPDGQTPLVKSTLDHHFLEVIREGAKARDDGTSSPYDGHSLEHCLHAAGWVQRDLRLALDKAFDAPPISALAEGNVIASKELIERTGGGWGEPVNTTFPPEQRHTPENPTPTDQAELPVGLQAALIQKAEKDGPLYIEDIKEVMACMSSSLDMPVIAWQHSTAPSIIRLDAVYRLNEAKQAVPFIPLVHQPAALRLIAERDAKADKIEKERVRLWSELRQAKGDRDAERAYSTTAEATIARLREALEKAKWYVEVYDNIGMNREQSDVLGLINAALHAQGEK